VIGIAHSGWRGTIAGIGIKMIELMKTEYWSDVGDIRVAIGPSIWPCCYTCKNQEQISLFEEKYSQIIHRDENVCVDLWDSIEKDILSIGIAPEHFENPRICTACHHDIYASHRADHPNTTTNLTTISISE
jgi:copper oxidase (laccase) domain-containing protein